MGNNLSSYEQIWKHLADKYDSEGASVEKILEEKSLHVILTRYFSHLSETEKNNLTSELREKEDKFGIPKDERL